MKIIAGGKCAIYSQLRKIGTLNETWQRET